MTDPIADMLSRIKNALDRRAESVDIPYSRINKRIAEILSDEGFVRQIKVLSLKRRQLIRIPLKYRANKAGLIMGLKRVSRPGQRIYADRASLPRVEGGFGCAVVSTSKGVMTGEQARENKLGGEVLCYIW